MYTLHADWQGPYSQTGNCNIVFNNGPSFKAHLVIPDVRIDIVYSMYGLYICMHRN